MRYRFLKVFVLLACWGYFSSCDNSISGKKASTSNFDTASAKENEIIFDINKINYKNVLSRNIKLFHFSDTGSMDTFRFTMYGDSILNGAFVLDIVTAGGKIIHSDTMINQELIFGEFDEHSSNKQKEDTVIARFNNFLNRESFVVPAVDTGNGGPLPELSIEDSAFYSVLIGDVHAIGLVISGYEWSKWIAYDKKRGVAVVYQSFSE